MTRGWRGRAWLALALLAGSCVSAQAAPSVLAQADSLYALGERVAARRLYSDAFEADPDQTRALFRLAELTDDRVEALKLYECYLVLEPSDAWGPMAAGDLLARSGRTSQALARYDHAARLARGERDVTVGRSRVLERAGRGGEAAAVLSRWLAQHPEDVELWQALGRNSLQCGKPRRAVAALEHASSGGPSGLQRRAVRDLELARALSGPAAQPVVVSSHDSDGNRTWGVGVRTDAMFADGARLGARMLHRDITGANATARLDDAGLELTLRPRSTLRVAADAGAVRLTSARSATAATTTWTGELRVRWQVPGHGPSLEFRTQRTPLAATPELIDNHTMRNEARLKADVPLAGFRLLAAAKAAVVESALDRNLRTGAELGVALPLGPALTPWARYEAGGYHDATTAGYFAPRRAEGMTLGSSLELGDGAPWTLELDLGGGLQRYAAHDAVRGEWRPGAEGYMYSTASLGAGRELRLELEASDSPGLSQSAAGSAQWSYYSASLSLRWALR
jgi:predicted TPR repeat methyltransferase